MPYTSNKKSISIFCWIMKSSNRKHQSGIAIFIPLFPFYPILECKSVIFMCLGHFFDEKPLCKV